MTAPQWVSVLFRDDPLFCGAHDGDCAPIARRAGVQPLMASDPRNLESKRQGPIFGKLLIPVDGSAASMAGVYEAIKIAALQQPSLRLLHILDGLYSNEPFEPGTIGQIVMDSSRQEANRILDEASEVFATYGLSAEHRLMESHENRVATQVIREAADWAADLIVMGTHGRRGITRLALWERRGRSRTHIARAGSVGASGHLDQAQRSHRTTQQRG